MLVSKLFKSSHFFISTTAKRFNKIDTTDKLKKFIYNSSKDNSLQQRYDSKKASTESIDLDIKNLLKLSSLPMQKTEEEIVHLKKHLLKYIQFTNMLDDVKLNTDSTIKCDNLGNPFLVQEEIIDNLEQLEEKIKLFNEMEKEDFSPKDNTKLNNANFYTYKKE
ncbi:hypothetical protein ACO0SA_000684 [Hanseniaspora valbyensis]